MATITNYCINPSFESNTDGWAASGGSLARVSVATTQGSWAARTTATASNGWTQIQTNGAGSPAVTPGQSWTVSCDAWSNDTLELEIWFVWWTGANATGSIVSVAESAGVVLTPTPQRLSFTATAPPTAASLNPYIIESTATITLGELWYVDGVFFGLEDSPYFDGDTVDGGGYVYEWTGTPHASTSTKTSIPVSDPPPIRPFNVRTNALLRR